MEDSLRRELAAAVGTSGMGADGTVHPANMAQLKDVLAACASARTAVAPRGAAPNRGDAGVVIDADNLDGIVVHSSSLLMHAGAAATWLEVREAASAQQLSVSGLPVVRSDRVGESVELGEIAHRTLVGVELLTPRGELIAAGGRTLKDVVGYDLAGLALGSGRRLGLVLAVTLRLDPAGSGIPAQPGPGPWRGDEAVDVSAAFAR